MAGRKLRGRRRARVAGSGGQRGCNNQREDAGAVCNGRVVVRERSGKRGKWGLGHRYIIIQIL